MQGELAHRFAIDAGNACGRANAETFGQGADDFNLLTAGTPYFPEVVADVLSKYQFAKLPTLDELLTDGHTFKFQIGKFEDVQISEFGVYGDGITASGKCPTELLDAFLDDVLAASEKALKIVPVLAHRNETYYESKIVVKSEADLAALVAPAAEGVVQKIVKEKLGVTFQSSGMVFDCDPAAVTGRRKPVRVFIERKIGFRYEENLFLCIAPLKTKDHIDLLVAIEKEAPQRR